MPTNTQVAVLRLALHIVDSNTIRNIEETQDTSDPRRTFSTG
jgi:hypothetical protein